jgi:hypothetical protein
MAAERRSNASTPVVADPTSWDNVLANEAEADFLADQMKQSLNLQESKMNNHYEEDIAEEVPEELESQADTSEEFVSRHGGRSAGPITEMSTGPVKIKRTGPTSNNIQPKAYMISGSGSSKRRLLPEVERLAILAGLRANFDSLMGIYGRISLGSDTVSTLNR